jgi:DNA-binding protein YbaB
MSDQVSRVNVTATNADGSVEVTVNGSGTVIDLRLGDLVRKRPAEDIAQEILRVMRRAQAKLAGRVAEIAADTVGADSATGQAVVATFERRYPTEPADDNVNSEHGSATDWRGRGR